MLQMLLYCCLWWVMVVHGEGANVTCSDGCKRSREDNQRHCNTTTRECQDGCEKDRWGIDCSKHCSDKCLNRICIDGHGACIACHRGKAGKTCSADCPSGCEDGLCFITNRTCVAGCRAGHCGQRCDQNCSDLPHVLGLVVGVVLVLVVVLVVVLVLICVVLRRWRRQNGRPQYSGVVLHPSPTPLDPGSRRQEINMT